MTKLLQEARTSVSDTGEALGQRPGEGEGHPCNSSRTSPMRREFFGSVTAVVCCVSVIPPRLFFRRSPCRYRM